MTQTEIHFDGSSYEPAHDQKRLGKQMQTVKEIMLHNSEFGVWMTLSELAGWADAPESSVSARIRDMRKARFGGYIVERRRRGDPKDGIHEYRINGQTWLDKTVRE